MWGDHLHNDRCAARDRLNGDCGSDVIYGGPGDDRVQAYSRGRNRIRCGPGRDVVELDRTDDAAKDSEQLILH